MDSQIRWTQKSSYGDREKKLEILKDPHTGAFAIISLCCYFLFCVWGDF